MDPLTTGVANLDRILDGGIPKGSYLQDAVRQARTVRVESDSAHR